MKGLSIEILGQSPFFILHESQHYSHIYTHTHTHFFPLPLISLLFTLGIHMKMASLKLSSLMFFILCIEISKAARVLTTFGGGGVQYGNPRSLGDSRYGNFKVNGYAKYNNDYYWGWIGGQGSSSYGDDYDSHRSSCKSGGGYKYANYGGGNIGDNSSEGSSVYIISKETKP